MAEQFRPGIDLNKAEEAVRSFTEQGIGHNVYEPSTLWPHQLTESFRAFKSTMGYNYLYNNHPKKEPK